jgi:glycosyltransferase involved in cell wall biosynthesis
VRSGNKSLVLAPAKSKTCGLLIPAQVPLGVLDERAKRESRNEFRKLLNRARHAFQVDIVHMHGIDFHNYLPGGELPVIATLHLPLAWYAPEALRPALPNVNLVCVSRSQARTAPKHVQIAQVIPNGIDLAHYRLTKRKSNYAVVMSRICPEKGIHLAIDAAERAGMDLIIAGAVFDYPEHRDYFEQMIRPRLNPRVRFIGPVGGSRKADLLAGARCLLMPSLAPETSSLTAMEAIASGTPVIALRSGALPEIVSSGRTGFLVNNADEMASAIPQANVISPIACREEAQQKFSSSRMCAQYLELYHSVLHVYAPTELQAA